MQHKQFTIPVRVS